MPSIQVVTNQIRRADGVKVRPHRLIVDKTKNPSRDTEADYGDIPAFARTIIATGEFIGTIWVHREGEGDNTMLDVRTHFRSALAAQLAAEGVEFDILDENGAPTGRTEIRKWEDPWVPVKIWPYQNESPEVQARMAITLDLVSNANIVPPSPTATARSLAALVNDHGMTLKEIRTATGLSMDLIKDAVSFASAPDVQRAVAAKDIPWTVARRIVREQDPELRATLVKAVTGKSTEEGRRLVEDIRAGRIGLDDLPPPVVSVSDDEAEFVTDEVKRPDDGGRPFLGYPAEPSTAPEADVPAKTEKVKKPAPRKPQRPTGAHLLDSVDLVVVKKLEAVASSAKFTPKEREVWTKSLEWVRLQVRKIEEAAKAGV